MSEMMRRCAEWSDASWGFLCTIVDGFHFLCVFSAGDWTWTRNCPVHNWSRTLNLFHHHCLCLCAEEETRKGEKIIKIIRSSLLSENENTKKYKLCTRKCQDFMHLLLDYYVDGFDGGLNYLVSQSICLSWFWCKYKQCTWWRELTLSVRIKGKNFVQNKS